MPHVELYINDQLIDLKGDESISVDYSIFDIEKIDKRGGARSYEFNLPKTNRNKSVLENPELINNLSVLPYSRMPCLILIDGVDVLIRFAEIASVKDSYAIRVYGSNSNLFADLADRNCKDLDLREYDHFRRSADGLVTSNIYLSRLNTEGYIYPVIDWHKDSPNSYINNNNRVVRVDYFLPSIYYNTVLDRIFSEIGYTLVNNISDDTANLLITSGSNSRNSLVDRYNASFSSSVDYSNTLTIETMSGYFVVLIYFNTVDSETSYFKQSIENNRPCSGQNITVPNPTNIGFLFANRIRCRVTYSVTIENTDVIGRSMAIGCRIGDTVQRSGYVFLAPGQTFSYSDSMVGETLYDRNSSVIPSAQVFYLLSAQQPSPVFTIKAGATCVISECEYIDNSADGYEYNPIQLNTFDYTTPSTIMMDMTQVDCVKNYMLMFALVPTVNEIDGIVTLNRFNSILAKLSMCYDWSDKIDFSEDYELTFINSNYGQNNYFQYKQDGDEQKPKDADGSIVINNKNLEFEKDIVELDFAASNELFRLNDLGVGDNTVNSIGVYNQGEYSSERVIRVLNLILKSSAEIGGSINYDDATAVLAFNDNIPFTTFIHDGNDFNLGFGNNLLANYYDFLSDILNRVKILKVYVRLSAADISQLDFSIPVFISKYESYFYISAVRAFSYTESKSTLVELVKLNING